MVKGTINIENAKIIFKNFSGREERFNPAGKRNFGVLLDPDIAEDLEKDGWNVRWLKPRDEDDGEKRPYIQVAVRFENIPPKITLIDGKGKAILDEASVSLLDHADIESVDLIIRPYNWEANGKTGVKAYLKSMWVTISEDPFERKYMDIENQELPF